MDNKPFLQLKVIVNFQVIQFQNVQSIDRASKVFVCVRLKVNLEEQILGNFGRSNGIKKGNKLVPQGGNKAVFLIFDHLFLAA